MDTGSLRLEYAEVKKNAEFFLPVGCCPDAGKKATNGETVAVGGRAELCLVAGVLLGWIENVARRSTTWGDVDLAAFCRKTGYSREHATRELTKIRRTRPDLVFETKHRKKRPRSDQPSTWGVIVCEASKLKLRSAITLLRPRRQATSQLHHAGVWRRKTATDVSFIFELADGSERFEREPFSSRFADKGL